MPPSVPTEEASFLPEDLVVLSLCSSLDGLLESLLKYRPKSVTGDTLLVHSTQEPGACPHLVTPVVLVIPRVPACADVASRSLP